MNIQMESGELSIKGTLSADIRGLPYVCPGLQCKAEKRDVCVYGHMGEFKIGRRGSGPGQFWS